MERLHLRQHHRLRQHAPRRGLHAGSTLQMAGAAHDLRDDDRAGDSPPSTRLPGEHQERQPLSEGAADQHLEWPGELTEYYHGTTAHNLLRGIIRDGLKPTFGAGADATESAWGTEDAHGVPLQEHRMRKLLPAP